MEMITLIHTVLILTATLWLIVVGPCNPIPPDEYTKGRTDHVSNQPNSTH